mgnify:CR=1 FL=1
MAGALAFRLGAPLPAFDTATIDNDSIKSAFNQSLNKSYARYCILNISLIILSKYNILKLSFCRIFSSVL